MSICDQNAGCNQEGCSKCCWRSTIVIEIDKEDRFLARIVYLLSHVSGLPKSVCGSYQEHSYKGKTTHGRAHRLPSVGPRDAYIHETCN